MPDSSANAQWIAFLADLRLVACVVAWGLYALWTRTARPGVVGLARLSLLVAFGATVVAYGLLQPPFEALPYLDFLLFASLAIFLVLEFLFQMSVLGLLVGAIGTALSALHYLGGAVWLGESSMRAAPASSAAAIYWGVIRDLTCTVGAASLLIGLGAGIVLHYIQDRRSTRLVHPNDLRDVTAVLARTTSACFSLAVVAALVALAYHPAPGLIDLVRVGALVGSLVSSIGWLVLAEQRQYRGRYVINWIGLNLLALATYAGAAPVLGHLTARPIIP